MNLESARKAAEFATMVKIVGTERTTTAPVYRVPGHGGRTYYVRLELVGNDIYTTCKRKDGTACPGNSKTVCYHSLAAIIAHTGDLPTKFCETREDAERVSRIKVRRLNAHVKEVHGGKTVYAVTYTIEKIDRRNQAAAEFKAMCAQVAPAQTAEQKAEVTATLARNRAILRGERDYAELI
jgi:hypothetical protein